MVSSEPSYDGDIQHPGGVAQFHVLKRDGIRKFRRQRRDGDFDAERFEGVHKQAIEVRDGARLKRDLLCASIAHIDSEAVVDEVKIDLEALPLPGNRARG